MEAEASARKGMSIDSSSTWINTNLALALLYQGKLEEAKGIYVALKDAPYGEGTYREVFLEDLRAMEEAGLRHEGVGEIRRVLEE